MLQGKQVDAYIDWLNKLSERGGKGTVNNVDARSLKRISDTLQEYHNFIDMVQTEMKYIDWEDSKEWFSTLREIEQKVKRIWNARTDN